MKQRLAKKLMKKMMLPAIVQDIGELMRERRRLLNRVQQLEEDMLGLQRRMLAHETRNADIVKTSYIRETGEGL